MSLVTRHWSRFLARVRFSSDEKNQPHAGANGGVGDVEGGKVNDAAAALLEVKINEINHVADANAVEEIAGDAAENQAKAI